ncbi:hypothetical protein VNO77_19334 [Canavalia gladiata]|uniref:Uncharacterized protein n=1 Tax=Canavalia gladiata TaxID=3824 RepID=A0AAN9QLA0_CANGL
MAEIGGTRASTGFMRITEGVHERMHVILVSYEECFLNDKLTRMQLILMPKPGLTIRMQKGYRPHDARSGKQLLSKANRGYNPSQNTGVCFKNVKLIPIKAIKARISLMKGPPETLLLWISPRIGISTSLLLPKQAAKGRFFFLEFSSQESPVEDQRPDQEPREKRVQK